MKQILNSQYCLDVKEVLKQTREAVVDMMCLTHDKIYYADLNSLHTELIRCQGRLEDTARWLERQEREALSLASREAVTT